MTVTLKYHKLLPGALIVLSLTACTDSSMNKSEARSHVLEYIDWNNTQLDGGNTMVAVDVDIREIREPAKDTAVIIYTWSGILKHPPLAQPLPDEKIKDRQEELLLYRKNGQWKFTDD